jgi:hypothetical protein
MAMIEFKPASKIVKEEENAEESLNQEERDIILSQLDAALTSKWEIAKTSKQITENQFLDNLRMRRREYTPQMQAALKQMFGQEYEAVYAPVVETKCSAAESWVKEIFFQKGERPWELEPTPMPELPESIQRVVEFNVRTAMEMRAQAEAQMGGVAPDPVMMEEAITSMMPQAQERVGKVLEKLAKDAAENVSKKIEDMFVEGEWNEALNQCIYDIVTFGTMIMKGPFLEREVIRKRVFDPETGRWIPQLEERLKEYWARVNPFDIYPMPGTTSTQKGDFFEVLRFTRKDLSDMLDVDGWDQDAVREVLKAYREGGHVEWKTTDQERILLEGKESSDMYESDTIECLKFHGSVPGQMLLDWGMGSKDVPDAEREYDIVAWKIGPWIIKATINPDPLGSRPYFTAGFREVPDSFWHVGVPELAEGAQKLANAVFRSISINVGIASGPQIEVDVDRLKPGEKFTMWPFRVWKATNQQLREGRAVEFFQPQIVTGPLMEVFEFCLRMADEDTGVPRYTHGEPKGTPETASALSMLMSQSAKGIKTVVKNIDEGVVAESVEYAYNYLMQYDDDIEAIGDLKSVATGSYALMAREQQAIRRTEFLVQTANPFDMEVLGTSGRAELLRQALKSLDIDPAKVIRDEKELESMAGGMPGNVPPKNAAGLLEGATPDRLTPGAPVPAAVETDAAGVPVAGRDNQAFESAPGVTP